jgi:hypothetical protein
MIKKKDPEIVANELADNLNDMLDAAFPRLSDYREAIETVLSVFEGILSGLKADERRAKS